MDGGTLFSGEFANAIHRIVIVESSEEATVVAEWERLANELKCARGVEGEDEMLVVLCVEEAEDGAASVLDQISHGDRSGVGRVRISEDVGAKQVEML